MFCIPWFHPFSSKGCTVYINCSLKKKKNSLLARHLAHSFTYWSWEKVHPFSCCSIFVLNLVKIQLEFPYPCKTSRASSSISAAKWFTSAQPYFKCLTDFNTTACACPLIPSIPIYKRLYSVCGICHQCSFQLSHLELGFQRDICKGSTPIAGAAFVT